MDSRAHLFGIRHHGPGSAASLVAALDALDPALVLIEGAPEAEPLAGYAALAGMQPPLAILHYQADDPANAIFAPFAEYSPEWQAIRWALARGRPIRFIDWPAAHALAYGKEQDTPPPEGDGDEQDTPPEPVPPPTYSDPLDMLAAVAGYSDGEAWWNALVESSQPGAAMFAAIEAAITELRGASEAEGGISPQREARDRVREAFMRLALRAALKDEPGDIAVVVGAWHVPALRAKVPQAEDKAAIRALEKVKVESAWVPWSDSRLASASGYGAGVTAPGWYRHLWQLQGESEAISPEAFAAGWQSRVSGLLREEGHAVASASTIEASRLAITLAALRGEATPGLADMHDATLAALCHGDEIAYRLIERRLLFGERVGAVDPAVPQMPLAADLERWQKRCRLKPEDLEREIALDLRTEAGLMKSTLLHRLALINVPWGRLLDAEAGRGTFRQTWRLAWNPGLAVNLAEALVYGVTIEQAAAGRTMAQSHDTNDVAVLAGLVKAALLADLPDAAEQCITRLQAAAVGSGDLVQLMDTVPTLVSILRYGTARPIPSEQLSALVSALAAEINAGAQAAAVDIEPAAAEAMRRAMAGYDRALALHDEAHLTEMWHRELAAIVQHDRSAPAVAGLALRLLHDGQVWEVERIAAGFSRALTPPAPPAAAGAFVESFLAGGAEVLIQDRPLLAALDTWLAELDSESFIELLPMLRRGFSGFAETGRQRIIGIIGSGTVAAASGPGAQDNDASPAFIAEALPLLRTIMGITP
ncbi:DUF5682 family protein [Porphyrobacter sp. ULC335]|uniref:DUF5682 family protein n=1 Tax=Porphyrobacter sp. ULC335 TaxID=2854260 RepID=UPI0022212568|nr:DUF5682 family protein [Porphyrobacter sp. ULC335]UYV15926.1 hypothetical protein KVF90_00805 [Porphyrobacter sp. ULC335]